MSTKIKILHRFSLQGKELNRDEQLIVSDSQAKHWTEQGLVEVVEKGDFPETGTIHLTPSNFVLTLDESFMPPKPIKTGKKAQQVSSKTEHTESKEGFVPLSKLPRNITNRIKTPQSNKPVKRAK